MAAHTDTGHMASPQNPISKTLNHLGLVSGMYDELGIGELIDRLIPQDTEKRQVSLGQAVKAMVLNGLGFTQRSLYLSPHFFRDKPVDRLIGEGIEADHLNDDVLGRALDQLFEYGVESLYSQVAVQAVQRLNLLARFGHLDSTGFHTDGQYPGSDADDDRVINITRGYSRDHRPDLNQVILQLICERQAGIPLLMEPLSGNSSDKDGFRRTIMTHVAQLKRDVGLEYIVADSALYTAQTLREMRDIYWLTRVPETLTLARDMVDAVASDLMVDKEQRACRSVGIVYGGIRQRWLVVYSPAAYQRTKNTLKRRFLKETASEIKALNTLCKQAFACETDARAALAAFEKKLKWTTVEQVTIQALPHFKGKGRPAADRQPDYYRYHIEAVLASRVDDYQRRLQRKSCFILATNQLDAKALSDDDMRDTYKDQQKVEGGFRFLKDPLFMASALFLKSPKRIMALTMIMTLCLLVYAALEYRIRQRLMETEARFPNQKGQLINAPTARWVFQYFSGIHLLVINSLQQWVLNMNNHHTELIELLGEPYRQIYSGVQ